MNCLTCFALWLQTWWRFVPEQAPDMRHLLRADYRSMPWRNGKGVTAEIAREPAEPAPFDWRLSLATLEQDGAFSHYPEYQRIVVLVEGAGFTLDIAGEPSQQLSSPGAAAIFPGDATVHCRLHDGPCRDLSLMVRIPGAVLAAQVLAPAPDVSLPLPVGVGRAVFALTGQVEVVSTGADGAQQRIALHEGDCGLLAESDHRVVVAANVPQATAVLLEWTHFQSRSARAHGAI